MEKLIDSVPETITKVVDENTGKKGQSGFCLRYSTREKTWLCGYGRSLRTSSGNPDRKKYAGVGFTAIEAVDDFVKNCFKNHIINK